MVSHEMSEAGHNSAIELFHFAVGLWVIGCNYQAFNNQTDTDGGNKFHTNRSSFSARTCICITLGDGPNIDEYSC